MTVDLQQGPARLGIKLFMRDPASFDRGEMIRTFHRWIQEDALGGTLIDVHDYTHVPQGPGVLLVAHEGHLRTDEADDQVGLEYEWKREGHGTFEDRLRATALRLLEAADLLSRETQEGARPVTFRTDEIRIRFTDRLAVENSDEAFARVTDLLDSVLRDWFDGAAFSFERVGHPRAPLTVRATTDPDTTPGVRDLLERVRAARVTSPT